MNKKSNYRLILKVTLLFFLGFIFRITPLHAHLMPAQQGTLNVVGADVFTVLAVPVSAVPQADGDGDGRLSEAEVQTHAAMLRQAVSQRLVLRDGDAALGRVLLLNPLSEPQAHPVGRDATVDGGSSGGAGSRHFLVMMRTQFAQPPQGLTVTTDLFGTAEGEGQLTLKASRGAEVEAVVLSPARPQHTLFQPLSQVVWSYVLTGIEHIVLGADHVLFLLTVMVAGWGWRYWGWVLTSFTLAHSLTLVAGLLGWVRVPAHVVEPLIAASIVWMALLNLWRLRPTRAVPPRLSQQVLTVFACGLLHGLGFAASMEALGLHDRHLLASLLGFNVGIELGQMGVLALSLLLLRVGAAMRGRMWPTLRAQHHTVSPQGDMALTDPTGAVRAHDRHSLMGVSIVALFAGTWWMWQRLSG
jgi:hydrogenase/urease accessory protein HupE